MVGLQLGQKQTMRQNLQQVMTQQQRVLVDMLELPEAQLEGYLEELLQVDSGLVRVGDARGVRDTRTAKAFVQRPDEDEATPIETRLAATQDLEERLMFQLREERSTEAERAAAEVIIGNLDGHGLLEIGLDEVANQVGCSDQDAEDAQWLVMQLDPPGCGASSPAQYLSFMVEQQWPDDPFFPELVRDHLDDLKKKRFDRIAKAMDMDEEDVAEYHTMLVQKVDPWPARGFATVTTDFVRASFRLERDPVSGRLQVVMLEAARPQVQVNAAMVARARALPDGPERKEVLRRLKHAQWVVQALEERHSLVKQVATVAVDEQARFFELGEDALQNLTMSDVASRLGRDTSSVSRAVSGRWYEWEGRMYRLRDLFANRGGGQDTSEKALHRAISRLIDAEDKKSPLSDDQIAVLLTRQGLTGVARRTVAKHRDRVGIPSSRDRRQR